MCVWVKGDENIEEYIIPSRFYRGKLPVISATDLELVKNITMKDSANFINREVRG